MYDASALNIKLHDTEVHRLYEHTQNVLQFYLKQMFHLVT